MDRPARPAEAGIPRPCPPALEPPRAAAALLWAPGGPPRFAGQGPPARKAAALSVDRPWWAVRFPGALRWSVPGHSPAVWHGLGSVFYPQGVSTVPLAVTVSWGGKQPSAQVPLCSCTLLREDRRGNRGTRGVLVRACGRPHKLWVVCRARSVRGASRPAWSPGSPVPSPGSVSFRPECTLHCLSSGGGTPRAGPPHCQPPCTLKPERPVAYTLLGLAPPPAGSLHCIFLRTLWSLSGDPREPWGWSPRALAVPAGTVVLGSERGRVPRREAAAPVSLSGPLRVTGR